MPLLTGPAPAEPAQAPAPRKMLKGVVRRNLMLKHVGDMAQQSKVRLAPQLVGWLAPQLVG